MALTSLCGLVFWWCSPGLLVCRTECIEGERGTGCWFCSCFRPTRHPACPEVGQSYLKLHSSDSVPAQTHCESFAAPCHGGASKIQNRVPSYTLPRHVEWMPYPSRNSHTGLTHLVL
uniref:Secreted protein n=1 Tax=Cacopsylla melanoneura TaxID=428564 RepID=A0A8D9E554_9HEMI